MSACREFQELLSMALDHPLPAVDLTRLHEHLSGCPKCREFEKDLAQAHTLVRGVESVEPPPWMASKIMARIRLETAPKPGFWRRAILPLLVKPQLQAAAVLLLCATTYFLVNSRSGNPVDEVLRDIRQPKAEPEQTAREAESPAKILVPQPKERRPVPQQPVDQARPGEAHTPIPRPEEIELRKDKGYFAPPPPAAPSPAAAAPPAPGRSAEAMDFATSRQASPKPSVAGDTAAAGSAAGGAAGRDERADLAKASKKAAAPAPEGRRDDRSEKLEVDDQPASILVQWEPDDPARARRILEQELVRLGATILPEVRDPRQGQAQSRSQARSLSARLDGERLAELIVRLGRHGSVRPAQAQQQRQRSGQVTVLIEW